MFFGRHLSYASPSQAPMMADGAAQSHMMMHHAPMAAGMAAPGMALGMPGMVPCDHIGPTEFDVCLPGCVPCAPIECEVPTHQVYVVQKGDTVYKIAQRYGLDWRELAAYNHLSNPDLIYPGQRLLIPSR